MRVEIRYTTGQYFGTEYRKAACAVLASAIWYFWREHCMPAPVAEGKYPSRAKATVFVSAGDWLRANARREFTRGVASRWFQ